MVYDWEGKRDLCYQMYIVDRKGLEEIMEFMKNTYEFAPRYDQNKYFSRQKTRKDKTNYVFEVNVPFRRSSNDGGSPRSKTPRTRTPSWFLGSRSSGSEMSANAIC
jgi:Clr5 domain